MALNDPKKTPAGSPKLPAKKVLAGRLQLSQEAMIGNHQLLCKVATGSLQLSQKASALSCPKSPYWLPTVAPKVLTGSFHLRQSRYW